MPDAHDLNGWTLLLVAQAAFTVWMLVDATRRGVEPSWYWLIFLVQPVGTWAYFFVYKLKDFPRASRWLADVFHRRPSLEELHHRLEQSPTPANWLELGQRLVEREEYAEALPHLQAALEREPEHCWTLFLLALAHRGLGHPEQAVAPLEKLVARHAGWKDYKAWHLLIAVCEQSGDQVRAVARCRELVRIAPSLENKCLLAVHLVKAGEKAEAQKIVEQALADYRYQTGVSRRRDGRWVGQAKQLLKQIS
jgi:hypothetical protein